MNFFQLFFLNNIFVHFIIYLFNIFPVLVERMYQIVAVKSNSPIETRTFSANTDEDAVSVKEEKKRKKEKKAKDKNRKKKDRIKKAAKVATNANVSHHYFSAAPLLH